MQVISVRGDHYSRGLEIGERAQKMIRNNVDYYMKLWKTYSDLEKEFVMRQAARFVPEIERYDPEILTEMRGLADGARLSLEEIVALNCRYEFVWAKMEVGASIGPRVSPECTALGIQPSPDTMSAPIIGQNWDYKRGVRNNCILLEEIQEPEKPNLVIHTEAGILGQKGMNSAGIGLLVNALLSDRDRYEPCVPFLLAVRAALNQRTLSEAIRRLTTAKRSVSGNLMLAKGSEVVDLELTPSSSELLRPSDAIISHANSFVGPAHSGTVVDAFDKILPDSIKRGERAGALLRGSQTKDQEAFEKILSDHSGYPHSICRHLADGEDEDLGSETLASIIMDVGSRVMRVCDGNPCSASYVEYRFPSLARELQV